MTKPLVVLAANESFEIFLKLEQLLEGKIALFVAPYLPNSHSKPSLPETVSDEIALIVESSGSTGEPKRIELSLDAIVNAATASSQYLGPAGQWLLALPLNFIAGQQVLIRSLIAKTQPVMMNSTVSFTAEAFIRSATLMTHKIKYSSLVPYQLVKLLALAKQDEFALETLRSFRALVIGGQSIPKELLLQAKALGLKVVESYGMTETAGGCVYDGIPLTGVKLKIAPDQRLQISGNTLANGLGEWLITNDLAKIESGKLEIIGRLDRVIISGGIKISLDRIEYLATNIQGVEEISAVSISDSSWGERVGLCYVGSPEVADDIATELAEILGAAGKPIRILRVDKLPRLGNGKPDLLSVARLFAGDIEL
jgi:o-succinylbenzoate---CoA ligase